MPRVLMVSGDQPHLSISHAPLYSLQVRISIYRILFGVSAPRITGYVVRLRIYGYLGPRHCA